MSRALPGSVVVFAALIFPELSVGAGDLGERRPPDDLPDPVRAAAPRPPTNLASPPRDKAFAGVRYAPLLSFDSPLGFGMEADVPLFAPLPVAPLPVAATPAARAAFADPSQGAAIAAAGPSLPVEAAPAFATEVRPATALGKADLAIIDNAALALVSQPIEPVALAAVTLPDVIADLPVSDNADGDAAQLADVTARAQSIGLGRVGGSFTTLLPPAEQAALQAPSVAALPVAVAGPAANPVRLPAVAPAAAPTPALAAALAVPRAPAMAVTSAPAAPVSRPAPQPVQQFAPAPVRKAASALAASPGAAVPASAPAPALAAIVAAKPPLTAPGLGTKSEFQLNIKAQLLTRVDGKTAGKVDFQQTASGLLVRLGSIVEVLGDRYDPAQLARIKASSASNAYLPLADLQAQGIPISYDPVYDEFNVGQTDTRPKAARKVHMDQISAPERGLGSTGMDQVPR